MTRELPGEVSNSVEQVTVQPFFAVDLEFDSPNQLYFWTGEHDITFDGRTYTGAANLMRISELRESSDLSANGATLTLSGIPSDLIGLAIDEPYQGRICRVRFGLLDSELSQTSFLDVGGGDLLLVDATDFLDISQQSPGSLFDVFVGYMDQMNIDEGPNTATISLAVENKLIDLERPRVRRYTHESQQIRYSGDLAFEFVTRLQDESLTWGS